MTDDFVLVPREPTPEMLWAANKAALSTAVLLDDTRFACEAATYRAMIAAAPVTSSPPTKQNDVTLIPSHTAAPPNYPEIPDSCAPSRAWTDAEVEAAARAHHEVICPASGTPMGGFSRFATWDEACQAQGLRKERMAAMRAALSTLPPTSLQNMQTTQPVSVPSREGVENLLQGRVRDEDLSWTVDDVIALFTAPQRGGG